jgi:anti-sigma factor RsiW
MAKCEDFLEVMYAFVARELPAARHEELQLHLDGCEACARALADYRRVIALAQELPTLPPPPALLDRFRDAVKDSEEPPQEP